MRILFAAAAGAHVPWIVPLSWACLVAGHEVRVAVRPQGVRDLTAAGLMAVPVGSEEEIDRAQSKHAGLAFGGSPRDLPAGWISRPELLDKGPRVAMANRLFAASEATVGDLVAFARQWRPDIVVYDTVVPAGLVAAAAVGVPAIGHTWGYSFGFDYRAEAELWTGYRRLFDRFGLDPIDPQVWIDPCVPGLRDPHRVPWAPMRLIPYNGPAVIPSWLAPPAGDQPRVCVTGGQTTSLLDRLLGRIVAGAHRFGAQVVLAVTKRDEDVVRGLPEDVLVVESFPLSLLIPTCDAVIHHGGMGTALMTAAAGIPQLVLPQSATQEFMARKVSDAGAGLTLHTPDEVGSAVEAVLAGSRYRDSALRLRAENEAAPAPPELVGLLENCARDGHVHTSALVHAA